MDILSTLAHIWQFQLFVIDGSPITLGKVVIGSVLIFVGHFAARATSHMIGRRVLATLNFAKPLRFTLEQVLYYFFYIGFTPFSLQILSIPITIFTLVGGALAIGIGFGSQNVVNNFISGLIVMVGQPIRVGDWIEIESVF